MTSSTRRSAAPLRPRDVEAIHDAVSNAETTLLFAATLDPALAPLRDRAIELSAELLATLAQLQRQLAGDGASPRETHASWVARQTAPSGVHHTPKPNARRHDAGDWPEHQANLARIKKRAWAG